MAVPMQLGVVPLYILFSEIGWTGSLGAIIIPALVSAFGVFWMTQYIRQAVPDELIEAARVDGATAFRTFLTVGVQTAVNLMAGAGRMPLVRYLPAVAVGSLIWAGVYTVAGVALLDVILRLVH